MSKDNFLRFPTILGIILGLSGGGIIGVAASVPLMLFQNAPLSDYTISFGYLLYSAIAIIGTSFLFFALYFRYKVIELPLLIGLIGGIVGGLITLQLIVNAKHILYAILMSLEILPSFVVAFFWKLVRQQKMQEEVVSVSQ